MVGEISSSCVTEQSASRKARRNFIMRNDVLFKFRFLCNIYVTTSTIWYVMSNGKLTVMTCRSMTLQISNKLLLRFFLVQPLRTYHCLLRLDLALFPFQAAFYIVIIVTEHLNMGHIQRLLSRLDICTIAV